MPKTPLLSLPLLLILQGCATPVPVAVSCPQPPQPPSVLTEPISTAPNLSARYETLIQAFKDSLTKAAKQP